MKGFHTRLASPPEMAACAACQTAFTQEQRGLKCTLCDDRRVAEPAYYCNRACQKQHWPEHKAFHAQIAAGVDLTTLLTTKVQKREFAPQSSDPVEALVFRMSQAVHSGDHRRAVKLAKKLISMDRARKPKAYILLGHVYLNSGDFTNAASHFLKAMELSDTGTEYNRLQGDETWARAACHAYTCFFGGDELAAVDQTICVAPKPAWFSDARRLKRMADRAVAALPNDPGVLQMRIVAYADFGDGASPSADDLRQALRDQRRLVEIEGRPLHLERAQKIEADLRARIAADLGLPV